MFPIDWIRSFLFADEFRKNLTWNAAGIIFGQLVLILSLPVLTRLYGPQDVGVLSVLLSITGIIVHLHTLKFEIAVPNPQDDADALGIMMIGLFVLFTFTSFTTFVLSVFVGSSGDRSFGPVGRYFWALPWFVFLNALYSLFFMWMLRKKDFKSIALARMIQGTLNAVAPMMFFRFKAIGLIISVVLSLTVSSFVLIMRFFRTVDPFHLRRLKVAGLKNLTRRYLAFSLFSTGQSVLESLSLQLFSIYLGLFFGTDSAGKFYVAQRVMEAPSVLIGQAVFHVIWSEIAQMHRERKSELRSFFVGISKKVFVLSSLSVILGATSPLTFTLFFGEAWKESGLYALVLTPMYVAYFVATSVNVLQIYELQHLAVLWNLSKFVVMVVVLFVSRGLGVHPVHTVLSYSVSMFVMYSVLYAINLGATLRRSRRAERTDAQ